MPSIAERPRSQEALLRLEKGTASPATQLNEAAQIIGLDLALCASHPEINKTAQVQHNAAPKEEWVLRWLLKKLKTGKNYRVEPASFLLLRQLIDLIPPKTLAMTLKDQKFLDILNGAVTDLEEDVLTGLANGGTEVLRSGSDSSHTLDGSPRESKKQDKKGTKRKRAGDDRDTTGVDEKQPQTLASCFLTFIRALDCLYSLVMLASRTLGLDEVASSHLKHALRGEPESVATLLGKSCKVAAISTTQFFNGQKTTDLQHLLYVFPAIVEVWELRSYRRDDSDNKSSNESFSKNCFKHALRLQLCVRSTQLDTEERAHVLHGLERLIALHVILPARAGFVDRGGKGIDYSADQPDWSAVKPITDTFQPILCEAGAPETADAKKARFWKTTELLPELFDTACRSVARDTFRRKTHEAAWLETLFVAVAELAYSIAKDESTSNHRSEFIHVLEQLFRVVLARQVQLSLHTLLTHAGYTELLKEELSQVEWGLTSLLIELGVDIFLPNSGLQDSSKLLNALLKKIFLHWRGVAPTSDGHYETIKGGIIIPLLRGFIAARDLPAFMQLWCEQLILVEEARSQDSALCAFSVWEDDDLCNVYSDMTRNPLTDAHVATQMQAAAGEIKDEDGKVSGSPRAYAQFVILEAGFRSRASYLADAGEPLNSIIETLRLTLSSKQTLHWRWRLWRFVRNLLENNQQSTDNDLGHAILNLTNVAAKTIQRHNKDKLKKARAALECLEAYQFALVTVKESIKPAELEKFNSLTGEVVKFITSISSEDALKSMKSPWNGRTETLDSPVCLSLGYILTLVKRPDVWNSIQPEIRRSLFEHILSLATSQHRSPSLALERAPPDARFLQAWASVVCHEYLLNAPGIAGDLVTVLSERLKDDTSNRQLHIESLQRIPGPLVTRRQRGVLLDLLQEVILREGSSNLDVTLGTLSLMAKLADMSKSNATLTADWEPVWKIAQAITLEGADIDLQIMTAFRNLHRAVVSKLLVLSEEERRKLFKKMYRKVTSKASKLKSIDRDSMDLFFLRISLSQLWLHRSQLTDAFDETELAACRAKVFGLVVADVKSARDRCKKQQLEETITLIKTLDALEDFEDLATDHTDVEKFLSKIESYVERSIDSASPLRRLIRRRVLAGRGPEKNITLPVMKFAETLPVQHLYGEEQRLFTRATMDRFRSMTVDDLTHVLEEVRGLGFTGEHAEDRLLVAGLAVASLAPVEDKESLIAKELSRLCTAVTELVQHSKSVEQFSLATECLDIILRNHPRCVAQWNVDSLLACVAISASKSGPLIDPEFAGTIYIRLCKLMGVLLGIHRQKLGGRFHLILPAMQRLLNCLFARSKKRTRSMRSETGQNLEAPFWLAPLQASHAVHFTRLLTSLCDPTVSAVSRPTQSGPGQDGLTDQTKKAKRIAGQYLQYLVMEYAQSSLRGSLTPEVKAAILPGLYTVLDVMSRETMRAMNAGLDVSGRAVFKGLYDDYVKFGKWNKG